MTPKLNPFRLDIGLDLDRKDKTSKAFKDGEALENHIKAVHNGEEADPECPACQELQKLQGGIDVRDQI